MSNTRDSFEYQWKHLAVSYTEAELALFRDQICEFTQLPSLWFQGKRVIDVGCGGGRYAWGLCELGCDVTATDQSESGLETTRELCGEFRPIILRHDILAPFDADLLGTFDLVWCFGVAHHTGDTFGALENVISLVKDGGYLFLMVYGIPTTLDEELKVAEHERLREEVRPLSFDARVKHIEQHISEEPKKIHGYFDAISPEINDLYAFDEIRGWLGARGFVDCRLTVENRNHRIMARKNA